MSTICALILCLLCLPLTTEAGSVAIPTNIAIIILAAIAGVYFFVTVVLVLLVCWCCCGRDRSKCAKVLPVNTRSRKNSYSSPQSTELDSLSSKRTSATDISSLTETEGGIIIRAVSKEYIREDGEKRTYVTTRTASSVVVEKPSPFISRKPAEPLPYRLSPLLGRKVAWSDPEKTEFTASSNLDKARDASASPVTRDQTGTVSPEIANQTLLPELSQYTVSGGAESGSTLSGGSAAAENRVETHTIKNKHAEDIDDDVFGPVNALKMDTNLNLALDKQEEAQVQAVRKNPVARTDSTMPLLDDSPEPSTSAGPYTAAVAFGIDSTETNVTSPALILEEQKQIAQQFKKPAGRSNSTKPLLENSSPESSRKSESPDIESEQTNTPALNSSPAVTFNEGKQEAKQQRRKKSAARTSSTKPLLENGTPEAGEVDAPLEPPMATRHKKRAWTSSSKLPPLDIARPRPSPVSAQDRLGMESHVNENSKKPVSESAHGRIGTEQPLSRDSLPHERVAVKTMVLEIEERKVVQESDGSLTFL